ncbi:MAG: hypothetical protein LBU97_00695, partial [Alistipes sp.]|nr:hypothetical protein [Alistipes sp.]
MIFFDNLSEKLRSVPLLRALVPMVIGVACGTWFGENEGVTTTDGLGGVPFYFWAAACVACGVMAALAVWFFERRQSKNGLGSRLGLGSESGSESVGRSGRGFEHGVATLYT